MKKLIVLSLLVLASFGCATRHEAMKGSVALKISDSKGVVCLFGEEPNEGERLVLLKSVCSDTGLGKEGSARSCKMIQAGQAKITKMLNSHYAEFETLDGSSFDEGYLIKLVK